jgi:electron transfer flavoprotein-quinone oxidoreductase
MEKLDVIIVGGGLSGLSCAYGLKEEGLNVLVLERGEFSGSKNVTGGRLYLKPLIPYVGDMFEGLPLERKVVRERWTLLGKGNSLTFDFTSDKLRNEDHSYTVLRAKLDRFLSEKVIEKGIFVIPKYRVDGIIRKNGKVEGVSVGEEMLYSKVVVLAEGALSILTRRLGIRGELSPDAYAIGVKEIIELPPEKINERFNVEKDEGVAHLFIGDVTHGIFGGGFLYTNKDTLSIGVVVKIGSIMSSYPKVKTYELMERFKETYEIRTLIEGGNVVEYSAHIIPEQGFRGVGKLYGDGFLVTGDAAGFSLNMGITVRGMDFAIVSGILAAETIKEAFAKGDFSERALSRYEERLRESFVLKDLESFREMPNLLEREEIFNYYPIRIPDFIEKLLYFGTGPKEKLWKEFKEFGKELLNFKTIKTMLKLRKV